MGQCHAYAHTLLHRGISPFNKPPARNCSKCTLLYKKTLVECAICIAISRAYTHTQTRTVAESLDIAPTAQHKTASEKMRSVCMRACARAKFNVTEAHFRAATLNSTRMLPRAREKKIWDVSNRSMHAAAIIEWEVCRV